MKNVNGPNTGTSAHDVVESLKFEENAQTKKLNQYKANLEKQWKLKKKYLNDDAKLQEDLQKKVAKLEDKLNKQTHEQKMAQYKEEFTYATSAAEKLKAVGKEFAEQFKEAGKQLVPKLDSGINQYLASYSQYMSGIETRLQGTSKSFGAILGTINSAIGYSPYVKQTEVLKNLSTMVEAGIAYNVEQRAFLETISDKIATTFSSFDASLLQIIRLQQADSTAARLGMEASLTQFFNRNFMDTSYLKDIYDTVSSSLFEAESQLGRDRSVELEYVIQKWLGSMYSTGVSSSTVSSIAQGIGYLGSGNISALSGNESLQRLLMMASSSAGLNYGTLATGGLTAKDANKLMRGIVDTMQNVALSGNQVLKSQYASLFGISISDMTAVLNLTDRVETIAKSLLSYDSAISETISQLGKVGSRMSVAEKVSTVFENVMANLGENIASNAVSYTSWLVADLVSNSLKTSLTTMGTTSDPVTLATTIIKSGIVGLSTLANMGTMLSALSNTFGGLSLDAWGAKDVLHTGWGFTGITTQGVSSERSSTYFIGDTSSSFYETAVAQSREAEAESIQGQKMDEEIGILEEQLDVLNSIFNLMSTTGVRVNLGITGGI